MGKWKLGIDGANTMNCGLEEEVAILSRLGFDTIEVRDYKLAEYLKTHTLDDVRRMLAEARLDPINMSAVELYVREPGADRRKEFEDSEWLLKMGQAIGSKMALMAHLPPFPGTMSTP